MLKLEKLTPDMFPDIDTLMSEGLSAPFPEVLRRKLFFDHGWASDEGYGYGLCDDGRLVGLMGMIFSRRAVAGTEYRFCNLHSWYVKPEYRSRSLAMLKPLMDMRDHVITDLTASKEVCAISRRLGFTCIDHTARLLPPCGARDNTGAERIDLIGDAPPELASLDEAQQRIYHDHQNLDCQFLLVRKGTARCLIVYSRIEQHRIPYALVHYMSDPGLFAEAHGSIRSRLLERTGGWYVVVESRMVEGLPIPHSFTVFANEKFCRFPESVSLMIDTLYSEVAILKLSVLPTFPQRIRRLMSPYVPEPVLNRIRSGLACLRR